MKEPLPRGTKTNRKEHLRHTFFYTTKGHKFKERRRITEKGEEYVQQTINCYNCGSYIPYSLLLDVMLSCNILIFYDILSSGTLIFQHGVSWLSKTLLNHITLNSCLKVEYNHDKSQPDPCILKPCNAKQVSERGSRMYVSVFSWTKLIANYNLFYRKKEREVILAIFFLQKPPQILTQDCLKPLCTNFCHDRIQGVAEN
ncbi:hypothetical protein NQ317_013825 [Molorchus minor]|uniref:Uncharacterized protein n=1 Tax=Molorchus minor TaxID=1323400 RepID=A0ABQ9JU91_9CUCU|nr:hypothetical protein NQ317_013825 [Molorchus minor]